MERHPIKSSNLASVGYDAATMTLEVEFQPNKKGESAVWSYTPVSQEIADSIRMAPSVGRSAGKMFIKMVKGKGSIAARHVETLNEVAKK